MVFRLPTVRLPAASSIVAPRLECFLAADVNSSPTPLAGSVTSLGFDVPVAGFSAPDQCVQSCIFETSEIADTLANGGLFDLTIGSGLSADQFIFEGSQMFGGTTAAPTFAMGNYSLSGWTYSDPSNFDAKSPSGAFATVVPAPEPSSLGLFAVAASLAALAAFRRKFTNSVR